MSKILRRVVVDLSDTRLHSVPAQVAVAAIAHRKAPRRKGLDGPRLRQGGGIPTR
jgi:hypothetical protein